MTDQNNPSSDLPPQPPQQAFGSAPPPPPPGTPPAPPVGPSFGEAPQPADAFGTAPPPPVEEKKKNTGKIIGAVVAVIVAVCVAAAIIGVKTFLSDDATKEAQTGNCIANLPDVGEGEDKEAPNAEVVDCSDTKAAYKVEGRLDGKTEAEAKDQAVCDAYTAAEFIYRAIDSKTDKGYVLCLSQIKK